MDEHHIDINTETDVMRAAMQARRCAEDCHFDENRKMLISTAISELAQNIIKYAGIGKIAIRKIEKDLNDGIEITVSDEGPGIDDIQYAMQDHMSTGGTMGLGLPGVKRMMDEFQIESIVGKGTTIIVRKWL